MNPESMGIKTLDPSDKQYRGDYINSDQTHGFNYHQGPEWLWPVGYFLKAKILFGKNDQNEILRFLLPHQRHIMSDRWRSLPELTNSGGKFCADSCNAQAWSIATVLSVMSDLVK